MICLSSTVMLAQKATSTHWTPVNGNGTPMAMSAVLVIDGVEAGEEALQLEIGIFDQDGNCRAAKLPKFKNGHYKYSPSIHGVPGETVSYTCRVWDHANNCELDCTFVPNEENPLVYTPGGDYGTSSAPYELTFTTGAATGIDKTITAYSSTKDHYYLIASPVGDVPFDNVTNLLTNDYDLFYFDQTADDEGKEWITQKGNGEFTQLSVGMGYLYANSGETDDENETVTLTFNGTAYEVEASTEMFETSLAYDAAAEFAGWNLMGNPFSVPAFLSHDYYRMNEEGYDLIAAADDAEGLPATEGCFVVAEGENENVTFYTTNPNAKRANLALNLSNGNSVIDRVVVRLGQGRRLPKFQLNRNSTKVYIPMDNEDYAVVTSEGMGEMPVCFKAENNGAYSLTLSTQNADFGYLHLIDNLTGADQDLLANPTYSFEARTSDYANRFRLVFATSSDDDSFAFFSNGNLVINNEGNATLQVVDVNGRIVKCENINGSANVNFNAASGVYMVRLINGDNVKVQKVVK